MHSLFRRVLVLCVLVCVAAPASALAAGGIPGGGGTARPGGSGGGGLDSNGGAQLVSGLAPFPNPTFPLAALVQYRSDGSKATLGVKIVNLGPLAGQTLDLTIDGALQVEFVVPPSGTFSDSFDSSKGDAIVTPHAGSVLLLTDTAGAWVGIGNFR
jgi:hypothetical protein